MSTEVINVMSYLISGLMVLERWLQCHVGKYPLRPLCGNLGSNAAGNTIKSLQPEEGRTSNFEVLTELQ